MKSEYSLLVVDDERIAREHMLQDIAWETLAITTLYEAEDGYQALEKIESYQPEIIILDIKMPGMNGVELLEEIHQRKYDSQIIALSGYSDFDAARKMLASGQVVEYLLKPASEDVMFEAVYKCIARLEEKERLRELQSHLDKVEASVRRSVVYHVLFGDQAEEEDTLELDTECYIQVAVLAAEEEERLREATHRELEREDTVLRYCFSCPQPARKALVFSGEEKTLPLEVENICRKLAKETGGYVGCGRLYRSEYQLNVSYQEALLAYVSRSFMEGERFRGIDRVERRIANLHEPWVTAEELREFLKAGDQEAVKKSVRRLLESALADHRDLLFQGEKNRLNIGQIRIFFANFVDSVLRDWPEEGNLTAILEARDIDELLRIVDGMLLSFCERQQTDSGGHKAALVRDAKEYIREHFAERLTLEEVARRVYINPSYLSRLFSEVEGCNFSDTIAQIRIQKAKEYLKDYRNKVYEIAEMVGYPNVKHFMRVFKKMEGMTPTEYREKQMFL